jgi:hypothetical protein
MRFAVIPGFWFCCGAVCALRAAPQLAGGAPRQSAIQLWDIKDRMADSFGVPEVHSDDEWHPRDPASSTPQLLSGLWHQICQAASMERGVRTFNFVLLFACG